MIPFTLLLLHPTRKRDGHPSTTHSGETLVVAALVMPFVEHLADRTVALSGICPHDRLFEKTLV